MGIDTTLPSDHGPVVEIDGERLRAVRTAFAPGAHEVWHVQREVEGSFALLDPQDGHVRLPYGSGWREAYRRLRFPC